MNKTELMRCPRHFCDQGQRNTVFAVAQTSDLDNNVSKTHITGIMLHKQYPSRHVVYCKTL